MSRRGCTAARTGSPARSTGPVEARDESVRALASARGSRLEDSYLSNCEKNSPRLCAQPISDAANRLDDIAAKLLAKRVDIDIHEVRRRIE